jgi:hypothetical protein
MRCPHEPAMSRDSSMSFITFLSDASAAKPTAVASVANLGSWIALPANYWP